MPGYIGKTLRVDLANRRTSVEEMPDEIHRTYLGGRAMAAYLLMKSCGPEVDPLGPNNKLHFLTGPLTGTQLPGSGRNSVAALSPLTGRFGEAQVGGYFGAELKRAGFDHVIVEGRSELPVYLWVHDGNVEIRDARAAWGLNTADAQDAIRAEVGDRFARTALIGPAGERMVRYACVMNDVNHAAGRSGMGAVMGSKNLKGLVVRGHEHVPVARPEVIREIAQKIAQNKALLDQHRKYGTTGVTSGLNASGGLPTRNFQTGHFEAGEALYADAFNETVLVDVDGCYACPLRCKRVVEAESPYAVDRRFGGPEYETIAAFGSNCGVSDLAAICKANELCAASGLDTISTGNVIAFAMECRERELLKKADLSGLDLTFGNAEAMVRAVEMIASREAIGDLLAEGVARMAKRVGAGASAFAMEAGGQELAMHMARQKPAMGLGYAIGPAGADHGLGLHDTAIANDGPGMLPWRELGVLKPMPLTELSANKVRALIYGQCWRTVLDSLSTCIFVPYSRSDLVSLVSAATGWNSSLFELMKVGQRGITLARFFNWRHGFTRNDDRLPERCFEPLPTGAMAGTAVDRQQFDSAIDLYHEMMGWDPATGKPGNGTLMELGLGWTRE